MALLLILHCGASRGFKGKGCGFGSGKPGLSHPGTSEQRLSPQSTGAINLLV